jgi:hypothetical protein
VELSQRNVGANEERARILGVGVSTLPVGVSTLHSTSARRFQFFQSKRKRLIVECVSSAGLIPINLPVKPSLEWRQRPTDNLESKGADAPLQKEWDGGEAHMTAEPSGNGGNAAPETPLFRPPYNPHCCWPMPPPFHDPQLREKNRNAFI